MLRYGSQGYKAINATEGGYKDRTLKATEEAPGIGFSRLQEGDTGIGFSRLQGYQGCWMGMQG